MTRFSKLPTEEQGWIDAYLDGTLTPEAFDALQDRMAASPALRAALRRALSVDHGLQLAAEAATDGGAAARSWQRREAEPPTQTRSPTPTQTRSPTRRRVGLLPLLLVAGAAFLLGIGLMVLTQSRPAANGLGPELVGGEPEHFAEGFAVLTGLHKARWPEDATPHREGDALGAETFRLASGLAEIQFYSGAQMTLEGPARITLVSAWEARCEEGAVRMRVPPAARGFRLHAPGSEIVDLGTEFGLVVRDGRGHVEVFDGEIALRHGSESEQILTNGLARQLAPGQPSAVAVPGAMQVPGAGRLSAENEGARERGFRRWAKAQAALSRDPRLIAHYIFEPDPAGPGIPNLAEPHRPERDGVVVLAETLAGRWPRHKQALAFAHPGARVRVNIPGTYTAFTFTAWVRIDNLDRRYSALFMADGYENGEPHWQIRDDGRLMLSVMVDETRPSVYKNDAAGLHRVYFSPPIWDASHSGQWMHLASVFDPETGEVRHHVDGEQVGRETIPVDFRVETLRIGNAEIGNWGQPFRDTPWFATRHLDGRMDELALFQAALTEAELRELFRQGVPGAAAP